MMRRVAYAAINALTAQKTMANIASITIISLRSIPNDLRRETPHRRTGVFPTISYCLRAVSTRCDRL